MEYALPEGVTRAFKTFFMYANEGLLNERQLRITAGFFAIGLGEGGMRYAQEITGLDHKTIEKGIFEIKDGNVIRGDGRIREVGGGRKMAYEINIDLLYRISSIVDRATYGNPAGELLYKNISLRDIKDELEKQGINISKDTIGKCLEELGYSRLQNQKMLQVGTPHPNSDEIKNYLYNTKEFYEENNLPCISVDTKNKIAIGNYKRNGSEYLPIGCPRLVYDHDFVYMPKIVPYGCYLTQQNCGIMVLNLSSDTAQLAVSSIRICIDNLIREKFGDVKKVLILCDCGGSNGRRVRLFKYELAKLAEEYGIEIQVCHFPPGESKFNMIEHRMFNHVSRNMAAKPIKSIDDAKNYIENTTTRQGLTVSCVIDESIYKTGIRISDKVFNSIDIELVGPVPGYSYIIKGFKSPEMVKSI